MVSAIGDNWQEYFPIKYPTVIPYNPVGTWNLQKHEWDALVLEVKQLKELLLRARAFDESTGQPDCEMEEKVAMIKAIAEKLGIDMDKVFK